MADKNNVDVLLWTHFFMVARLPASFFRFRHLQIENDSMTAFDIFFRIAKTGKRKKNPIESVKVPVSR